MTMFKRTERPETLKDKRGKRAWFLRTVRNCSKFSSAIFSINSAASTLLVRFVKLRFKLLILSTLLRWYTDAWEVYYAQFL